jgi:hypothetical protein
MLKNITLSAEEKKLSAARKQAAARGTTLNEQFRQMVDNLAMTPEKKSLRYQALMKRLSYVNAGRRFTREEMNER